MVRGKTRRRRPGTNFGRGFNTARRLYENARRPNSIELTTRTHLVRPPGRGRWRDRVKTVTLFVTTFSTIRNRMDESGSLFTHGDISGRWVQIVRQPYFLSFRPLTTSYTPRHGARGCVVFLRGTDVVVTVCARVNIHPGCTQRDSRPPRTVPTGRARDIYDCRVFIYFITRPYV